MARSFLLQFTNSILDVEVGELEISTLQFFSSRVVQVAAEVRWQFFERRRAAADPYLFFSPAT